MGVPDPRQFTSADAENIKRKAKRLVRRHNLSKEDVEDVAQELSLHVWLRLPRYDAARGSREGFIGTVVGNKAANIAEGERAQKRDRRSDVPLDKPPPLAGPDTRESLDMALDVGNAINQLPPDLRDTAVRLMTQSVAEISRETGLTRGAIRHRVDTIRRRFEEAGIFLRTQQPTDAQTR